MCCLVEVGHFRNAKHIRRHHTRVRQNRHADLKACYRGAPQFGLNAPRTSSFAVVAVDLESAKLDVKLCYEVFKPVVIILQKFVGYFFLQGFDYEVGRNLEVLEKQNKDFEFAP